MFKQRFLVLLVLAALAALICACSPLEAQTSYQGQLTDSSGNPVSDGNYQMTFRLYSAEDDTVDAAVWSENQTVPVNDGLFNVTLGDTETITTSLFAEKLWLGVEVESDGEMTPRQMLTGAPYAMSLVPGAAVLGTINKHDPFPASLNVGNSGNGYGIGVAALGEAGIAVDGSDVGQTGLLIDSFTHGAVITSTDGTALWVSASGGGVGDWWGVRADGHVGDGVFGRSYGPNDEDTGLTGRAENGRAIYGFTLGAGQYAGYFADPIFVNGGCTGCTTSYVGQNTSDLILRPGDAVRVSGVDAPLEGMQAPVIQVAHAALDQPVLGVVVGRTTVEMVSGGDDSIQPGAQFGPVGGDAASGDYLIFVMQGPAQVRASDSKIQAGDMVYQGGAGISTEAVGTAVGMALEAVDADGMVWVLVGFH